MLRRTSIYAAAFALGLAGPAFSQQQQPGQASPRGQPQPGQVQQGQPVEQGPQTPQGQPGQPVEQGGITRTILRTMEVPDGKHLVVLVLAEIAPNTTTARYTVPGQEMGFVLDGEADILVPGAAILHLDEGDTYESKASVPIHLKTGPKPVKILVTFVVAKDKPLVTPAP
jgi:hypothetical protein